MEGRLRLAAVSKRDGRYKLSAAGAADASRRQTTTKRRCLPERFTQLRCCDVKEQLGA
jgi:hypothetical protein